jgi:hypothetical protein
LKSTSENFTWTCFRVHECCITLGIIGNFHSMTKAFLDVFSPSVSEYVDPVFEDILDHDDHIMLQLRHSTSKVKFYFYGFYVFSYVVLY